jgi:integrase
LKPPDKGQRAFWDDKLACFGVRCRKGGTKTFVLKLRNEFITLGRFGVLSLAEARAEAKRLLAERTLGKVRPQSITFPTAKELFLGEKRKARREGTVANHEDRLKRHFPFVGQLREITHSDIMRRLSKLSNSEHDHALSVGNTFFNWCVARRYIDDNPCRGISPRGSKPRNRILNAQELKAVWEACHDPNTGLPKPYRDIVRLLILCGQRRGEIAALRISFIEGNIATLPGEVCKNGRQHTFPLPSLAQELLRVRFET